MIQNVRKRLKCELDENTDCIDSTNGNRGLLVVTVIQTRNDGKFGSVFGRCGGRTQCKTIFVTFGFSLFQFVITHHVYFARISPNDHLLSFCICAADALPSMRRLTSVVHVHATSICSA